MSESLKKKLSSRKFWLAVAAFACAVGALLGLSESTTAQITAVITAGGVVVAYIFGESLVDASVK